MLLNFTVENFRSFRDTTTLSMEVVGNNPACKTKLPYNFKF